MDKLKLKNTIVLGNEYLNLTDIEKYLYVTFSLKHKNKVKKKRLILL